MPSAASAADEKTVKKLVLCFDGTGNVFSGSTADTNVVKIYDKLDRDADEQYHYYQSEFAIFYLVASLRRNSWYRHLRHQRRFYEQEFLGRYYQ